jgi:hypothetical protein
MLPNGLQETQLNGSWIVAGLVCRRCVVDKSKVPSRRKPRVGGSIKRLHAAEDLMDLEIACKRLESLIALGWGLKIVRGKRNEKRFGGERRKKSFTEFQPSCSLY